MAAPADHQPYLEAIWSKVDDDQPRLVYADWLSERGDPLGELIAVQCELHRRGADRQRKPAATTMKATSAEADRLKALYADWIAEKAAPTAASPPKEETIEALTKREAKLLAKHREEWLAAFGDGVKAIEFRRGFPWSIELSPIALARLKPLMNQPGWATVERLVFGARRGSRPSALFSAQLRNLKAAYVVSDAAIDKLDKLPEPLPIERLGLQIAGGEAGPEVASLATFDDMLPRLRHLGVSAYELTDAADPGQFVELPAQLQTLELRVARPDGAGWCDASQWPGVLESVTLKLDGGWGEAADVVYARKSGAVDVTLRLREGFDFKRAVEAVSRVGTLTLVAPIEDTTLTAAEIDRVLAPRCEQLIVERRAPDFYPDASDLTRWVLGSNSDVDF